VSGGRRSVHRQGWVVSVTSRDIYVRQSVLSLVWCMVWDKAFSSLCKYVYKYVCMYVYTTLHSEGHSGFSTSITIGWCIYLYIYIFCAYTVGLCIYFVEGHIYLYLVV